MSDLRMAVRHLVKSPGFSSVAVLSLAVGIGANTAIFSLVYAFLLRPLPVRNPHELVLLRNVDGQGGRMSRSGENNGSIDPVTGRAASTSFSLLAFVPHRDVVEFVRDRRLHGRGIGWIDAHLLASALVGRLTLWTTDPRLAVVARELGIAYD
jgi:hypothetical protein